MIDTERLFVCSEFGFNPPPDALPQKPRKKYERTKPIIKKPTQYHYHREYHRKYYLKHKDKIQKYQYEYYNEHREKHIKLCKSYYHNKSKDKIECSNCGKYIMAHHLEKHKNTKRCRYFQMSCFNENIDD